MLITLTLFSSRHHLVVLKNSGSDKLFVKVISLLIHWIHIENAAKVEYGEIQKYIKNPQIENFGLPKFLQGGFLFELKQAL